MLKTFLNILNTNAFECTTSCLCECARIALGIHNIRRIFAIANVLLLLNAVNRVCTLGLNQKFESKL